MGSKSRASLGATLLAAVTLCAPPVASAAPGATTPTDAWIVHCHAATENCAASASWNEESRTTDTSFDCRQAPVARGFFLGDYVGLGTDGTSFFPFFTISSAADHASIFARKAG